MRALALWALLLSGCLYDWWRNSPPEPIKDVPISVPVYNAHRLSNGLQVIHYSTPHTPLVVVQVVLRVGTSALPERQAGLLKIWLASTSLAGIEDLRTFDRLGDDPNVSLAPSYAALTMTVEAPAVEGALAVLAGMVRVRRLKPQQFERAQARQIELLWAQEQDPYAVALRVLLRALYGARHPLAQPILGTVDTVSGLTAADLESFHESYVGPGNIAVIMAGGINDANAVEAAQNAFGDWHAQVRPPPPLPRPEPPAQRKVWFVPKAGLGQSIIIIGGRGPGAGDSDELPFSIAVDLLSRQISGSLRSRDIFLNRTTLLTSAQPGGGYYAIATSVPVDATASALGEINSRAVSLTVLGLPQWRMPRFRLNTALFAAGRFMTLEGIVGAAGEFFWLGRPMDYPQKLLGMINAATADDVQDACTRYLDHDHLQIAVIGDSALADEVEKLKLGPMEFEEPK